MTENVILHLLLVAFCRITPFRMHHQFGDTLHAKSSTSSASPLEVNALLTGNVCICLCPLVPTLPGCAESIIASVGLYSNAVLLGDQEPQHRRLIVIQILVSAFLGVYLGTLEILITKELCLNQASHCCIRKETRFFRHFVQ